jgi:quinohemoprotein ethanol dehydrogenase
MRCHGVGVKSSGLYPDLRHAAREVHERWNDVVIGGLHSDRGMASFGDVLSTEDAGAVHAYVIERALHEPTLFERLVAWLAESPLCIPASWTTD